MQQQNHSGHVASVGYSLFVFIALLILTAITVFTAKKVDLGSFNFIFALIVASLKAGLIISVFMGLKWDRTKINLMIFFTALFFIFIFFAVILFDYEYRGAIDKVEKVYDLEMGYAPAVKGIKKSRTNPKFISFQDLAKLKQQMMLGELPKEFLKLQQQSESSEHSSEDSEQLQKSQDLEKSEDSDKMQEVKQIENSEESQKSEQTENSEESQKSEQTENSKESQ